MHSSGKYERCLSLWEREWAEDGENASLETTTKYFTDPIINYVDICYYYYEI